MKYLEHLTRNLKIAELIKSKRGPLGGHMLAKPPENISVGDIVRALEGQVAITNCADEEEKLCGMCNRAGQCLSQSVWIGASKVLFDYLDKVTIGSLVLKKRDADAQNSRILS
jgi:Rrf2 family protein